MDAQGVPYIIASSARESYPVVPFFGLLWTSARNSVAIPMDYPLGGEWGDCLSEGMPLLPENPFPEKMSLCWLSLLEKKFYVFEDKLDVEKIKEFYESLFSLDSSEIYFILGMGPFGECALWIKNSIKSELILTGFGQQSDLSLSTLFPVRPDLSVDEFCEMMLAQSGEGHADEVLSVDDIKSRYKRYNYRLKIDYDKWEDEAWKNLGKTQYDLQMEDTKIRRFDGTFSKTEELFNFTPGSILKKLSIKFNIGKTGFECCFFLDYEELRGIFERFYGAHPDTKSDFIVRMDPDKKKYELALFRQGLREPVVIPESAYQLIVFKNKFEDYRSDNYSQPKGAWIW